jgi:hypothetical protein
LKSTWNSSISNLLFTANRAESISLANTYEFNCVCHYLKLNKALLSFIHSPHFWRALNTHLTFIYICIENIVEFNDSNLFKLSLLWWIARQYNIASNFQVSMMCITLSWARWSLVQSSTEPTQAVFIASAESASYQKDLLAQLTCLLS